MAGEFTALPDSRASVCLLDWKDWPPLGIQGLFLLLKLMKMAKELKICTTESLEFVYYTVQVTLRCYKWLRSLGQLVQRTQSMATQPFWHLRWLGEGRPKTRVWNRKYLEVPCHSEHPWKVGIQRKSLTYSHCSPGGLSLCVVLISWCSCNSPAQRAPQPFPCKAATCTRHSWHTTTLASCGQNASSTNLTFNP